MPGGGQDSLQGGHLGRLLLTEQLSQGSLGRRVHQPCHRETRVFLEPLHRLDRLGPVDPIDLSGVIAGGGEVGLERGHVVGHPLTRVGETLFIETSCVHEQSCPGNLERVRSGRERHTGLGDECPLIDPGHGIIERRLRLLHHLDRLRVHEHDVNGGVGVCLDRFPELGSRVEHGLPGRLQIVACGLDVADRQLHILE